MKNQLAIFLILCTFTSFYVNSQTYSNYIHQEEITIPAFNSANMNFFTQTSDYKLACQPIYNSQRVGNRGKPDKTVYGFELMFNLYIEHAQYQDVGIEINYFCGDWADDVDVLPLEETCETYYETHHKQTFKTHKFTCALREFEPHCTIMACGLNKNFYLPEQTIMITATGFVENPKTTK